MSVLSAYMRWFDAQERHVQIGSVTALFALLFVAGLYTGGVLPGIVAVALLIDHWYRDVWSA